jgi:RNA polymerase sigma factor (sigma-70 family)
MQTNAQEILSLEALWIQVLADNEDALRQMHAVLYSPLLHYANTLLQDEMMAEDAIQDLFIKLWTKRQKIGPIHHINAYCYTLLRRQSLNLLRSKQQGIRKMALLTAASPDIEFSAEDIVMRREAESERRQLIQETLNQLPARQKEVIFLKFFINLDYKEIASIMRINYQSVVNLVHKAVQFLKDVLGKLLGIAGVLWLVTVLVQAS